MRWLSVIVCACVLWHPRPTAATESAPTGAAAPATEYRDRLIDGGRLTPQIVADGVAGLDPDGWPRSLSVQLTTSGLANDEFDSDESGLRIGGMLDTPNYGAFTLDASWRTSDSYGFGSGGLVTLLQRGLPVQGGWSVNNALGVFNTPTTDLSRHQYRFFVPTLPTAGGASDWIRDDGLSIYAAAGQPGLFTGVYVPAFEGSGGQLGTVGVQWRPPGAWGAAAQMIRVDNVDLNPGRLPGDGRVSRQSWFGALSWDGHDAAAQLNLVDSSERDGAGGLGAWLDTVVRSDRVWHNAGAFVLGSDLTWGNQQLSSAMQGAYYRASYQDRQWIAGGGLDYVEPTAGDRSPTTYGTGDVRYQFRAGLGVGGGGSARLGPSDGWSAFTYVDQRNRWGLGRAQIGHGHDQSRSATQVTLDQTWDVSAGRRLSTALIANRITIEEDTVDTLGIALNGGGDIAPSLVLDANVRYDTTFGRGGTDDLLASIALNWMFATGWTLSANYYENRVQGRVQITTPSPIPDPVQFLPDDRRDTGYFLTLRYDWQAGSPSVPLGGVAGRGSGRVTGVLYLDANDNGRMDAGEAGASNVVVLLDGRFAARTDSEGRYDFPTVAAGDHFLTVVPDNLPLPWTVPPDSNVPVRVEARDVARVEIPARRLR